MGKRKRKNTAATRDIPYERCYEKAGMIETRRGVFTHAYEIIPPKRTKEMTYSHDRACEGIRKIFKLAAERPFQFVIRNARIPVNNYLEKIQLKSSGNVKLHTHIEDYNSFLSDNVEIGHNNHESRIYLVISTDGMDAAGAAEEFANADLAITEAFDGLYGYKAEPMSLLDRLNLLRSIYHMGCKNEESKIEIKGKVPTKQQIAPGTVSYERSFMRLDGKYLRMLFLNVFPPDMPESLLNDISAMSGNSIISMSCVPLDSVLGLWAAAERVRANTRTEVLALRDTIEDRREKKQLITESMIEETEEAYFYKYAQDIFLQSKDGEPVLLVTLLVALISDTQDELDRDTSLLRLAVSKYGGQIRTCDYLQKEAFQSVLPLNRGKVHFERAFLLKKIAGVFPVNVQSLFETKPMFQGLNMINDNFIFTDRQSCPVGMIAGAAHMGKTFAIKRDAMNALMTTRDRVFILTDKPQEYDSFLTEVDGKRLVFVPDSFAKDPDYALIDDNGVFGRLFLEASMAMKTGYYRERYSQTERETIKNHISMEAEMIMFQNFSTVSEAVAYANGNPEAFPLFLSAFGGCKEILHGDFSRCNVIPCMDLQTMVVMVDFLWNFAIHEKKSNRGIWIYVDGCDELLYSTESSDYILALMDKAEKLQVPITFVLNDAVHVVTNQDASIELDYFVKKVSFFKLLSMGPIERKWFVERLEINDTLVPFMADREPGEGVLITPTTNVAFSDRFGTETSEFYRLFT